MAFSHSFSPDIYGDPYDTHPLETRKRNGKTYRRKPTTVCEALIAMPVKQWREMCDDVFGMAPDYIDLDMVLSKVIETDTVSNLDTPVTFWIDNGGWYTVDVYDYPRKENK